MFLDRMLYFSTALTLCFYAVRYLTSIHQPNPFTAMTTSSKNQTLSSFFSELEQIYPLSVPLQEALAGHITRECLPARTLLLEEGEVCKRVYYLESGLARGFYRMGKEEIPSCS